LRLSALVAGLGVGPNFQSPMLALQSSVAPHDIAPATSAFGFVRQLANSISIVVGNVLLQNQLKARRPRLVEAGIEGRVVERLTGGAAVSSTMEILRLPPLQRRVAVEMFAQSMSKMWILYAGVGIVGLGLTDFIRRQKLSEQHQETRTGLEEQERIRRNELAPKLSETEQRVQYSFSEGNIAELPAYGPFGKSAEVLGLDAWVRNSGTPTLDSKFDHVLMSLDRDSKNFLTNSGAATYEKGISTSEDFMVRNTLQATPNDASAPRPEKIKGAMRSFREHAKRRVRRISSTTIALRASNDWFDGKSELDSKEAVDDSGLDRDRLNSDDSNALSPTTMGPGGCPTGKVSSIQSQSQNDPRRVPLSEFPFYGLGSKNSRTTVDLEHWNWPVEPFSQLNAKKGTTYRRE
jgi:hypothetical protein